jgi:hypothetical protein
MAMHTRTRTAVALMVAGIAAIGSTQAQMIVSADGNMTSVSHVEQAPPQAQTNGPAPQDTVGFPWT